MVVRMAVVSMPGGVCGGVCMSGSICSVVDDGWPVVVGAASDGGQCGVMCLRKINMTKKCTFSSKILLPCMILIVNIFVMDHIAMAQRLEGNETSRRLRIAVPVKDGFKEFADVKQDPTTGEPTFSGFSIDIFKAVVNTAMPYTVLYEFVPFAKSDGTMNGTYDDMVKAVFSGDYDAAVGDITIRYYRTEWVDFTMPYSDTGVSMLVPLRQKNGGTDSGSSRTKLTKGLIGVAVGVCFLCLIAALIPVFFDSAKRPTPMIEQNIDDLVTKGRNVGYQKGSFVFNMLLQRGFSESQLKSFSNVDELLKLLSQGTEQGGIDAAIEETPFLKLFLTQHCNAYTIVASADMHADGFGSPLVHDVSVAILKVTNNDPQLRNITKRTIGNFDTCLADISADYDILFDWEPTKWILVAGGTSVVLLIVILSFGCCKRVN
ncbi:Glutamate receptor 2.7 [Bienertia sinuspersici]